MKSLKLILMAMVGLITTAHYSQAGLGSSLGECRQQYGEPTAGPKSDKVGRIEYDFQTKGYSIMVILINNKVSRIGYYKPEGFDVTRVSHLLTSDAPEAIWGDANKDEGDGSYRWNDEGLSYFAALWTPTTLCIWTREDNDVLSGIAKNRVNDL